MVENILILYWNLKGYEDLPYEHREELPVQKLSEVISTVYNKDYNLLISHLPTKVVVSIDKKMFKQQG